MSEKYFKQPSVMSAQQHFSQVPSVNIPRSTFDRSHAYKTTFDAGKVVPIFWDEVLPGDTHEMHATGFARLATPLKPIMDNIYLDVHWFFVPTRLVWDNWQKFMGERVNPSDDPEDYSIPQTAINVGAIQPDSLASYMGLPFRSGVANPINVSALPFRAYQLIWNEWYRDENVNNSVVISKGDGPDLTDYEGSGSVLWRNKRKDYFTGALPWPQKGSEVFLPIGDTAPVKSTTSASNESVKNTGANTQLQINSNSGTLYADLASATSISINDFRLAVAMQQMFERDARGGTRYIEVILYQFGVQSDDARLQRPEYLGGSSDGVNINPVASTFRNTEVPQGDLAGIGTSVSNSGFTKSFTEHGFLFGLASVRADLTYQQGVERSWLRKIRNEFYWPPFAHLGEQAVQNIEIYVQGTPADTEVFGYQERYAEYRYKPSRITGLFASEQPTSLDVWHLSQEFSAAPVLNQSFIQENPPIDRVIAVATEPHFIADFWLKLKSTRPMPVYSVPGLERL